MAKNGSLSSLSLFTSHPTGVDNAVAFIDSTDAATPVHIATLMSVNSAQSFWCDVKVYEGVAYIVKDVVSDQGIQVNAGRDRKKVMEGAVGLFDGLSRGFEFGRVSAKTMS